ncbi:MAG: hypothetical protein GXP63_02970 [DPANN group archaeon]|nr:hypothetical protein [DPANN group archaeon]
MALDYPTIERVPTYVESLDANLQGGIPKGNITLISGSAGTMKSSLCFNILYNESLAGKNSLYISLEQSSRSLLAHINNLGYDLSKVNIVLINDIAKLTQKMSEMKQSGNLVIADVAAIRKQVKGMEMGPSADWLNVIKNIISRMKEANTLDHFVLDSMSALYVLTHFEHPRAALFHIFEFLRDSGITSFLISEMPLDRSKYSQFEVEDYLADGIILLELTERQRKVTRELSVVKMRATNCNNDVWTLEFKNGKFKVLYGGQPPLL